MLWCRGYSVFEGRAKTGRIGPGVLWEGRRGQTTSPCWWCWRRQSRMRALEHPWNVGTCFYASSRVNSPRGSSSCLFVIDRRLLYPCLLPVFITVGLKTWGSFNYRAARVFDVAKIPRDRLCVIDVNSNTWKGYYSYLLVVYRIVWLPRFISRGLVSCRLLASRVVSHVSPPSVYHLVSSSYLMWSYLLTSFAISSHLVPHRFISPRLTSCPLRSSRLLSFYTNHPILSHFISCHLLLR